MCQRLGVTWQSFYRWLKCPNEIRREEDNNLLSEIKRISLGNHKVFGAPRIAKTLRENNIPCGKDRVKRFMDRLISNPKRELNTKRQPILCIKEKLLQILLIRTLDLIR